MLLEPDKRWPGQSAPESSQSIPDRSLSPTLHVQYVTAHASNIHNKFPPYTVKLREYALTSVRKKKGRKNQVSLDQKEKSPLASTRPILETGNSKDSLRFYE